jgi:hypothetical protein
MNLKSLANLRAPWKRGASENPVRINQKRPITDEYYARGNEPVPEPLCKKLKLRIGTTWAQAQAAVQFYESVVKGSTSAAKETREAIEGKSPQRLDDSGPERQEVTLRVVYEDRED